MIKAKGYDFPSKVKVFHDGAYLTPIEITKENGTTVCMWVLVEESSDGTMWEDGQEVNYPQEADTLKELLTEKEFDDKDDK